LKIAIVGAGVAGSFLYALLVQNTRHHVDIYDAKPIRGMGCAWAVPERQFKDLLSEVGLNAYDYLLSRVSLTDSEGVVYKLHNMITINKPRLLSDLVKSKLIKVTKVTSPPKGYDLIVDATGFERALLGPPKGIYFYASCVQYVSEVPTLVEGQAAAALSPYGYAWAMPLVKDRYHYGAGAIVKEHVYELLRKLECRHPRKKDYCSCKKTILASAPSLIEPKILRLNETVIVGVGEAVGTTQVFSYEGIVPALKSAKLLAENIEDVDAYISLLIADSEFKYHRPLTLAYQDFLRSRFFNTFKLIKNMPKGRYGSEISKLSKLKLTAKMLLSLWFG